MTLFSYDYPRPMVTVDAVVFADGSGEKHVALVRRKNEPYKGSWALPGGFVEMDESLDKAVMRELQEETGLRNVPLTQLHCFGDPGRDPRGRTISVVFAGELLSKEALCANDDAAAAEWFPVNALPPLAFDHAAILAFALAHFNFSQD
ncbi:MAG TPA: NUDIX hydrolase [Candidatus Hydrogenedentes bacterium]|nr:NUDIX hydrolase [Candidatus Hydrogenedentota bacterium]HOM48374.1 NUDIX hydrolase [Candidatus Hydrogenedentota bacterium]HOR51077.1 NUDIX hydrolase [Candidatus Hydrogenedentota bacterium]HPK25011.1 NUDIX hydrolase [Candidatus Hydrogenedentota bacterium]